MKRIVNIKKFIISSTILILLIAGALSIMSNITYSYSETKYKTIYVGEGDTLWDIAVVEKENNGYYRNKDVRDIVYSIKQVNNLSISNLKVNQKLLIPVY